MFYNNQSNELEQFALLEDKSSFAITNSQKLLLVLIYRLYIY